MAGMHGARTRDALKHGSFQGCCDVAVSRQTPVEVGVGVDPTVALRPRRASNAVRLTNSAPTYHGPTTSWTPAVSGTAPIFCSARSMTTWLTVPGFQPGGPAGPALSGRRAALRPAPSTVRVCERTLNYRVALVKRRQPTLQYGDPGRTPTGFHLLCRQALRVLRGPSRGAGER